MGRKKIIDRGEIKKSFTLVVEDKYLINQNKDELRAVAYSAIVNHVNQRNCESNQNKTKWKVGYVDSEGTVHVIEDIKEINNQKTK